MNGLGQLVELHFAIGVLVGAGLVLQGSDAVFLVTVQPGADGAPSELIGVAGQNIGEGASGDVLDALAHGGAGRLVDGIQDAQA